MAVLKEAATLTDGGPVVFPGRRQGKPLSNMALLMVLRRLGRTDITAHGFPQLVSGLGGVCDDEADGRRRAGAGMTKRPKRTGTASRGR